MKLLAIDTSSEACAVGVSVDGNMVTRDEQQPREHTRILMPMIREALADAGVGLSELDAIVLGNGPGSFIGLRIAASVAQGLAFGADIGIVPVSSMAAVAAEAGREGDTVAVTQDAHMHEVYLGLYRIDARGLPADLLPERLQSQEAISELENHDNIIAAGSGWQRYPILLEANRDRFASVSDALYPVARHILLLGAAAYSSGGAVSPDTIDPAYLRQKVAEKPPAAKP